MTGAIVSGNAGQISGRVSAVNVVRALMDRPASGGGPPQSRDRPVLVFEGARGSGKTALLNELTALLDQGVPHTRIDLETNPRPTSVPDVLSALAFELGRTCPLYGNLRFPRFVIGRLVLRAQLDLDTHPRARRQVTDLLEEDRNGAKLREILLTTANGLVEDVGQQTAMPVKWLAPVAGHVVESALNRMISSARGQRIVLGSFHGWYGSRGLGLENDAIDVLVDLNRWGRNPEDEDNRQRIEELLWDAFLTDLREEFRRSKHATKLTLNSVAMLDNVDTEVGQRFLNGLVKARSKRAAAGRLAPDPLTVLATSRGAALADLPAAGIADLATGNLDHPAIGGSEIGTRFWWARYRLADLTEDETAGMVSALALREGNTERLTRMVHELSGGHPASTRLLVDAVAESPDHRDDLAAVLDQPEPGGGPNRLRVEERIRQRLLVGLSDDVFDDLVTCAATRDRTDALRLAQDSELLASGPNSYPVIKEVLWPESGGAGPVVLRRLLLCLLSRRTAGDPSDWPRVFSWLRAHDEQKTGELYYALAGRDLTFVTDRLRERLTHDGPARWLEVLAEVTSAPRRPLAEGVEVPAPFDQMLALLGEITPPGQRVEPLVRIIAARWIVDDPFTDSRRASLHRHLQADLLHLAASSSGDTDPLLRAAAQHGRQADLWH
ncbi:MAG: hypothetical protein ACR2GH_02040 [Pseudonocardia sp.]